MQDFYRQPEFCSACHKASLPPELNGYKWLRSFTPYDEWQDSIFSKQNPLTFYQVDYESCQDCHMQQEVISQPYAGTKGAAFASHRWLAGNTAVPFNYGYDEQLDKTIAFLKSGNFIGVDLFGLKAADSEQMPALVGTEPVDLSPGEVVQAYVVIQNKGIGHSFIPELRDLYEAWVHFSVKDASGATIYESGFLEPDGTVDPHAHSFINRPIDAAGNFIDDHTVWNEHAEGYDNTIQSGNWGNWGQTGRSLDSRWGLRSLGTRGQTGRSPTSYRREEPIKTSPLIFYVNSPPTDKMIPTEPNPFLI